MKKTIIKSLATAVALLAIGSEAWAIPNQYDLIVANTNSAASGSTKIGMLYPHSGGAGWLAGPDLNTTAPSTQKTLGATKTRQTIMYRKADGNTYLVDGQIAYGNGSWSANFDGNQEEAIWLNSNLSAQFKLIPEEIEIDPDTNDVFALVSGLTAFAPKQIYRIKRDENQTLIATAMTFHNASGEITPNGNRAFINPTGNGYKSGSIAFIPKPGSGHRLVFTHQSTVYQGICHWVWDLKTGAQENQLWASEHSTNVPISKCQRSTLLTGFGTSVNGINTVYLGPQTALPNGGIIPGRFLMSRNGGPLYEVGGLLSHSPLWTATPITPASPNHSLNNDFAWYRNY
jgi:hypothetical protein